MKTLITGPVIRRPPSLRGMWLVVLCITGGHAQDSLWWTQWNGEWNGDDGITYDLRFQDGSASLGYTSKNTGRRETYAGKTIGDRVTVELARTSNHDDFDIPRSIQGDARENWLRNLRAMKLTARLSHDRSGAFSLRLGGRVTASATKSAFSSAISIGGSVWLTRALADLALKGLSVREHTENGPASVVVSGTVVNQGSLPVLDSELRLVSVGTLSGTQILKIENTGLLPAGKEAAIQWVIPKYQEPVKGRPSPDNNGALPADAHSLRLMVDFPGVVPEADEKNNFQVTQGLNPADGRYFVESLSMSYLGQETRRKEAGLALRDAREKYERSLTAAEQDYQELIKAMEKLKSAENAVAEADRKRAEASARALGPPPGDMDPGYASLLSQIESHRASLDAAVATLDQIKAKQNSVGLSRSDMERRSTTSAEIDRLQEQTAADESALKKLSEKLGYDRQMEQAKADLEAQEEGYWTLQREANERRNDASSAEARAIAADEIMRSALNAYNQAAARISVLESAGNAVIRAVQVINAQNETVFAAEVWAPDPDDLRELETRIESAEESLSVLKSSHAEAMKHWRESVTRMDLAGGGLYTAVRNSGYAQWAVQVGYTLLDVRDAAMKGGMAGALIEVIKKKVEEEVFGEWKPEELKPNVYVDPSSPAWGVLDKAARKTATTSAASKWALNAINQRFAKGDLIRMLDEYGAGTADLNALQQQAKKLQSAQSNFLKFKKDLLNPRKFGTDVMRSMGKDLSKKYFTRQVAEFFEREAVQEYAAATAEMRSAAQLLVESLAALKKGEDDFELLASVKKEFLDGYDPKKHLVIYPGIPFSEDETLAVLLLNEAPAKRRLSVALGREEAAEVLRDHQSLRYQVKAKSLNGEGKGPVELRIAVSE